MKRSIFALLLFFSSFISPSIAFDDNELDQTIMPLGSELDDSYDAFLNSLFEDSTDKNIQILVLPVAYEPILEGQLDDEKAEIETACNKLVDVD